MLTIWTSVSVRPINDGTYTVPEVSQYRVSNRLGVVMTIAPERKSPMATEMLSLCF